MARTLISSARTNIARGTRKIVNGNMLINGDFENAPTSNVPTTTAARWIDGTAGGSTTNNTYKWAYRASAGSVAAGFDITTPRTGRYSLKLSTTATGSYIETDLYNSAGNPSADEVQRLFIPVNKINVYRNNSYVITYWMKTNYISGDATNGAFLMVREYTTQGGSSLAQSSTTAVKTTTDWTKYTITVILNSSTAYITIVPAIYGHQGTATLIMDAWFDDIVVKPVPLIPKYTRDLVNPNIVPNGTFEYFPSTNTAATTTTGKYIDGTAGGAANNGNGYQWYFSKSGTASAKFDNQIYYSGNASLKLSTSATASYVEIFNTNNLGAGATYNTKTLVGIKGGTQYTYSFWMKTNYTSGTSNHGAYLAINISDINGGSITSIETAYIKTTTDWTKYTANFTPAANAAYLTINLRIYGHTGTGTLIMDAWFDDLIIKPTTAVTRTLA